MDYRNTSPNKELYRQLKQLPKIELHRHLEGSLRLATIADVAKTYKLNLPGYQIDDFRHLVQVMPDDKPNADVFLAKFLTLRHVFRSPDIVDRITYEAIADAAAENIVYMELRFTPMALSKATGMTLLEATDIVLGARDRAVSEMDIEVNLIVSPNRAESVEIAAESLQAAIARQDRGVVGFDLSGPEHTVKAKPYAHLFHKAREAGLGITLHAGEWSGPESVREAIELIHTSRLGHGVRIVEDSDVVRMAIDREIAFEVCVTSNVQTGVYKDYSQHSIQDLYQLGALTTINTDDPSLSGINLTDEMVYIMKDVNFSLDDIKQNIMNAAQVAFLPDDEKQKLIKHLTSRLYSETTRAGNTS